MWLRWLRMRLLRFLRVTMSKRYRLLLILINTLERLSINYHLVNCMYPSDTDTAIRVGEHPRANYFIVSEKGVSYTVSPLNSDSEEFRADVIAATVMAAADVQITE